MSPPTSAGAAAIGPVTQDCKKVALSLKNPLQMEAVLRSRCCWRIPVAMTGSSWSWSSNIKRSGCVLWLLVAGAAFMPGAVMAEPRTAPNEPVAFYLPAQALPSAIEAYSVASGWQVIYDASLATGRQSAPVRGQYAPAAALRTLLAGTGLMAEFMGGRRRHAASGSGSDEPGTARLGSPCPRLLRASPGKPQARFLCGSADSGARLSDCARVLDRRVGNGDPRCVARLDR